MARISDLPCFGQGADQFTRAALPKFAIDQPVTNFGNKGARASPWFWCRFRFDAPQRACGNHGTNITSAAPGSIERNPRTHCTVSSQRQPETSSCTAEYTRIKQTRPSGKDLVNIPV